MADAVRAALAQVSWTGDAESTIAAHEEHAREAARRGARVLGFQQLFHTPYFCQAEAGPQHDWAEEVPEGPTVTRLRALARETGLVLVAPVFEREQSGHYYNTAAVLDADGSFLGKYRKHHIPQAAGAHEKYYFKPGNLGWPVFDTAAGRVGVCLCYDRHFPEGWRELGLAGAQLVYNPSAVPRGPHDHLWRLEQPAAAVANQYYVAAVNRVGTDGPGRSAFHGGSYFVDPVGRLVGEPAGAGDELLVRDLDLGLIDEVRRQLAFYRDRRPDTYQGLVRS